MGFDQYPPLPPSLIREGKSNSPKRIYRPNVLTSYRLKKFAFTLSEVLITLGIIGVVASMTIPSLIQDHREKETVAKLKKVYSILSQALVSAINDTGMTVDQWDLKDEDSKEGSQVLLNQYFKPYFKIADDCKKINTCIGSKKYLYLNGTPHIAYNFQGSYKHLVLEDGTLIIFHVSPGFKKCSTDYIGLYSNATNCAEIFVDTNGYYRGPNQFGKDFFVFEMKKDRILPTGTQQEHPDFSQTCSFNRALASNCTAWVIQNENMDYLHCDDLQWGTKTKCK